MTIVDEILAYSPHLFSIAVLNIIIWAILWSRRAAWFHIKGLFTLSFKSLRACFPLFSPAGRPAANKALWDRRLKTISLFILSLLVLVVRLGGLRLVAEAGQEVI